MDSETKAILTVTLSIVSGILLFLTISIGGSYLHNEIKYDNFQATIGDLNNEQKCLHICGFQYPSGYFDQYKFCVEKCDRISERTLQASTCN